MNTQGTAWPNVLADLVTKRDALTTVIDMIRTHFVGDTPGEMPDSAAAAVPARGAGKRKSAARGTNERTNERSKAHASSAEPP